MKFFESLIALPGAVASLTRVLINHTISDVALGRVTDETRAKSALYNALFDKNNPDHCSPASMYDTMAKDAPKGDSYMEHQRLTDEEWEIFGGKHPKLGLRQLHASRKPMVDLLTGPKDIKAWNRFSEVTQRELAVSVEKSLDSAAERYAGWVAERPNATNMRRASNTDAALAVVPGLITEYEALPAVAKALAATTRPLAERVA